MSASLATAQGMVRPALWAGVFVAGGRIESPVDVRGSLSPCRVMAVGVALGGGSSGVCVGVREGRLLGLTVGAGVMGWPARDIGVMVGVAVASVTGALAREQPVVRPMNKIIK